MGDHSPQQRSDPRVTGICIPKCINPPDNLELSRGGGVILGCDCNRLDCRLVSIGARGQATSAEVRCPGDSLLQLK